MTAGEALANGLATLGLDLDANAQTKLLAFVELLEKWNHSYNLTAIREPGRMITHHLLDSLAVLSHLPAAGSLRLIDIGSGGGLPGIPLAIARPAWQVTLLDSNRKKGAFLQQGINELGLGNAALAMARVEEYEPGERFDIAIARAFSDLASFAAAATPLVTAEGKLMAMKGVYPRDEIAALPRGIRVVAVPALHVPGVDAERHLVIMERANKERAEE